MATYKPSKSPVFQQLFSPVTEVYQDSERKYDCQAITDLDFLEIGVLRCLTDSKTGRDFIQRHGDHQRLDVDTNLFFKAFKSPRRITNLDSVNSLIKLIVTSSSADPYASIPELEKFAIYSGDGHFHGGAVHDAKIPTKDGGERKPATGHFFMINQRTHYMSHIGTADMGGSRKGEHDMHALKNCDVDELRGFEPKGKKVLLVWDRAGIDFKFWNKVKFSSGLYFISREKENMVLISIEDLDFDREDPRNNGVISDEKVEPSTYDVAVRRIVYRDPITGNVFKFITTEMTLPPGIICLLYKQRWDIEKVFDEFKNKMDEKKSWGSGEESKTAHALFLCLTHNLLLIIEAMLAGEGIANDSERERKACRLEKAIESGGNFVATFVQRCTVRSLKFIRWLRNLVYREVSWVDAAARLRQIYANF